MKCAAKHRFAILVTVIVHVFLENLVMLTKNIMPISLYGKYVAKHYANLDKFMMFILTNLKIVKQYCHNRLDEEVVKVYILTANILFVYSAVWLVSNTAAFLISQIYPQHEIASHTDTVLLCSILIGTWITFKPHVDNDIVAQATRYVNKYFIVHKENTKDENATNSR